MTAKPADSLLSSLSSSDRWLIGLACALLFVWSLPGTIALRLFIIVVLLGLAVWKYLQPGLGIGETLRTHRKLFFTYGVLTLWIVVEALLFADDTAAVLKEFWGQWIRSGITGLIGFLVAALLVRRLPHRGGPLLATALMLTLALQVGLHDLDTLWRWWDEGSLPFQETRITQNRAGLSFVTNLLMALLSAEAMSRLLYRRSYMPIHWAWLLLLVGLCFFATYVLGTRYGTMGFLALLISCAIVALIAKRREINLALLVGAAAVVLAGIGAFGWSAMKSDQRWLSFAETVPIALDTEHQRAWRDDAQPLPLMANGSPVDHSAYMRFAWGKEAFLAIGRDPFGVGYGRNAFGTAMLRIHEDYASSKHCHSGVLNFAVGAGIPGLLLWLGFLGILAVNGWRSFFRDENPAGLLLLFVVSGFFMRSIVDGNFQDHMFEQFMFLAMLFNALALESQRTE
ncbi:O-antigen ligase family protein [Rhodocyclus purpureus]|uniref:O-antigen ligase family protein n=1 Tax=Rhodocyclus purpureus TaxID=1067 RepID=UPI001911D93A|nr:O-antigen ligase family protein [Rhodocyclus purpureus]MBK5913182.1 hypothetical protein [Rhodocyclus purpureus]